MKKILCVITAIAVMFSLCISVLADEGEADSSETIVWGNDDQKSDGSDLGEMAEDVTINMAQSSADQLVICLDPGHGGDDVGSTLYDGSYEYLINLKLANYLKNELEQYKGVKVVLTRTGDTTVSLYDRAAIAYKNNADILISMHTNAINEHTASGATLIIPNKNYKPEFYTIGYKLCTDILAEFNKIGLKAFSGIVTRTIDADDPDLDDYPGVYTYKDGSLGDYYGVIRNSKKFNIPAVIIEHGFGDNKNDFTNFLSTDKKILALAQADARGIAEYYDLEVGEETDAENEFVNVGDDWYYYVDGEKSSYTGLVRGTINDEMTATWKVVKGKIDFDYKGLYKDDGQWWYISEGSVCEWYIGFVSNSKGDWYVYKGKVDFDINSVVKGKVNGETAWWWVVKNKVIYKDGIAKNANGWWKITNGRVDFGYTGFASNSYGDWYVKNGKLQIGFTSVVKGTIGSKTAWWYIKNGKVSYTDTVAKNSNGWWKITDGRVDFSFNGIAENENGTWYIRRGAVDFSYTGYVTYNGESYYVERGRVW